VVAYDNDDEDGQKTIKHLMKEANNRVGLTHYKTRLTEVYVGGLYSIVHLLFIYLSFYSGLAC
jgi:hypothetical protein